MAAITLMDETFADNVLSVTFFFCNKSASSFYNPFSSLIES